MKQATLKDLRIAKGYTQKQVALLLGKSLRYISALENGKRNPSDKMKYSMAKLYGVTVIEFFLACDRTKRSKKKGETKDERKSIDS